jgi:antitoxin component YwqK of YwqJK toxin-antitoxin module
MRSLFLIIIEITILLPLVPSAQKAPVTDTTRSVYKNLPTLKTYAVSSSSLSSADTSWFKINDKSVDETTYRKFTQFQGVYDNCRPCILLGYDINDRLLYKSIIYGGECQVGYRIEYYPNGKVKVIGHYKENDTGNWDELSERGYCVKDGVWTYFNNNGIATHSEIWKDGKFVEKVPVKKK